ncbi:hypothetical protein D9M69_447130 [compost metagenome]
MGRHHAVAAVDLGIMEAGAIDAGLQVVRHDQPGHATEEGEHAHVRADPIRERLGPGRLGERIARRAEHADEQFRLANLAGLAIDDRHPLAGIVHEGLVASGMLLAHRRRQALLEAAEQFAEAAIAVSVGMDTAIFLPEDQQRDARLLQLDRELSPIRFLASPLALLDPGAGEKPMLKRIVGQFSGQWPGQPRHGCSLQIILHGAACNAEHHRDLAATCSASGKPEHLS